MRALVTGGAGFIGSNLADALLARGDRVVVLDDLSAGSRDNVGPGAELVVADVADAGAVARAAAGCDAVFHLAAHKAVLRSVEHPIETDRANTGGTLAVLVAARDAGARRVVYASSSSVYGGAAELPTEESAPCVPRSPYAVSKLAGEHYVRVFAELYGLEAVSLRFFNVYGPRQSPQSRYAAVIPLFIDALREGRPPEVHGDGRQSRDFTYIDDVVAACLAAAAAPPGDCAGQAYNAACGGSHTLLDLISALERILGVTAAPRHTDPRAGDLRHSQADVSAIATALGWKAETGFEDGLRRTVAWFSERHPLT
ncbi:MAG: NAD-dependent epimerase/dehydratase family protein [Acidimicrobiales bacterium]